MGYPIKYITSFRLVLKYNKNIFNRHDFRYEHHDSRHELYYYHRTISKESLDRVDKRLDKISAALYGLRPRYIVFDLVARILINLITIIISLYCDK